MVASGSLVAQYAIYIFVIVLSTCRAEMGDFLQHEILRTKYTSFIYVL
jgi:hypothetical protein